MKNRLLAYLLKNKVNLQSSKKSHGSSNFYNSLLLNTRYFSTTTSKHKQNINNQKYQDSCKILKLDTDFSSTNYKPLSEKDIRSAFRTEARTKHPDTDSIPESSDLTDA